jgi:Zn-dependent protease
MADGAFSGAWAWSVPCGRLFGVDVRLHWTLFVVSAFDGFGMLGRGVPWWAVAVFMAIWILSILMHELGHIFMARLVGGEADSLHLWALGGFGGCSAPARPGPQFAVAAAGPLVTGLLAAACWIGSRELTDAGQVPLLALFLGYGAGVNLTLLLFNLIPAYPLDGGRMLRSALWPLSGRARAVRWTIYTAYVILPLLAFAAFRYQDERLLIIALMLFIAVILEHRLVRMGYDPEFTGADFVPELGGFLARWRARRSAAAEARSERHAAAEQAELDRLLAKVSEHGLPSLSAGERRMLQRISERERERKDRGL